ncbi:hypothetical protein [Streptomyces niger]|uniref:hypothetical protein n=1 Tax=Streptomyces niger TaxID=66373 RepID=UPI00069C1D2A|nr:hypothetical protein [Streptomyces niger]
MQSETDFRDIPPEQALFVLDMKGYSQIRECRMSPVRGDLDDILAHVFSQSGLADEWADGRPYKDTGDGAIFVLPTARMWRLVDPLLGNLDQALARYDRDRLARTPAIRLRASIHVGPLTPDDHRGNAINDACRFVNSDLAYAGMEAAVESDAYVAAIVSGAAFSRTVGAGRSDRLSESHFLPATAQVPGKPSFIESAYIHVPGVPPANIARHLPADPTGQQRDGTPATSHAPGGPTQGSAAPKFQFNNTNVGTVAEHVGTIHQPINFPSA